MALSDDLRERVVGAVVEGGMSRNARPSVSGSVSPAPCDGWRASKPRERFRRRRRGDRRSGRIEAHRDYLLGLIRRQPDSDASEIRPGCDGNGLRLAMRRRRS